jgi:protocatechuate 3,4-dioxygenase beta subunit
MLLRLLLLVAQVPAGILSPTGVVTGIVRTDTNLPLGGVRVAVIPADTAIADSVLESLGLTDSTGRYRLENVSPGRYFILIGRGGMPIYHPGVAELGRATRIQVAAGATTEVPDMLFGGSHVTGRVVDMATGKGRGIMNLVLCCDPSRPVLGASPNVGPPFGASVTTIADDGSFIFPSVKPGNYFLSTQDPGVARVSWALAVGASGTTELRLEVSEGVEVQGTVGDQTGQPAAAQIRLRPKPALSAFNTISPPTNITADTRTVIPKAGLSLDGLHELLLKSARVQSTTPGPDGRFAFRSVYPGAYVLEASTGGIALLEREIQVEIDGVTSVSLQVPAIHLAGRVIAPGGGPLPKLNYIRLVRSGSEAEVFYGFPDAQGRFSFLLLPGTYRVLTERLGPSVESVSDGSRDITNTEVTLEGGRNQEIVVTLRGL